MVTYTIPANWWAVKRISPMRVVNHSNNRVYFISLASVQRRIKLPTDVGLGVRLALPPIEFQTRLQAAVFEYKPNFFRQILSKPALVVNLSDMSERVSDKEFFRTCATDV